jgi:hypothetical protein
VGEIGDMSAVSVPFAMWMQGGDWRERRGEAEAFEQDDGDVGYMQVALTVLG